MKPTNSTHSIRLEDAFSAPDARFHAACQDALRQIQQSSHMRPARCLRRAILLAAALILLLALSITGFATGLFDSIFTRMSADGFAGEPSTDYGRLEQSASQLLFDQTVRFDSGAACKVRLERAYYNGQQLVLAWKLLPLGESAWLYDRDDPRYADAEYSDTWFNLDGALPQETEVEFDRRLAEDGWAGVAWHEFTISESPRLKGVPGVDHAFDGSTQATEDTRLYPALIRPWRENGATSLYVEIETPLPESAQNLGLLPLTFKLTSTERCHAQQSGDFGAWEARFGSEEQEFTISIPRSTPYEGRDLHADARFPDFSAAIDLTLTPIYASFTIDCEVSDDWPAILAERSQDEFYFPMDLSRDICVDFEYWVETSNGLVRIEADLHASDQLDQTGKLLLPEDATALHIRPFYANSGAHPEEDVIIGL